MNEEKEIVYTFTIKRRHVIASFVALSLVVVFSYLNVVRAVTPNPGHPWTEVGDGVFAVTGPTSLRTFTFPNANATVYTSLTATGTFSGAVGIGVLNPVNNLAVSGNALIGSGITGSTAPTNGLLVEGNVGIGTTSPYQKLSVVGTIVASSFSGVTTATSTFAGGINVTSGCVAVNGTCITSSSSATPIVESVYVKPVGGLVLGTLVNAANSSLTVRKVVLFDVANDFTLNSLSFRVAAVTTAGTYRICIYSGDGATKLMDVVSGTTVVETNTVTVSPALTLPQGQYWLAMGCATTCSNTVTSYAGTAATWVHGNTVPAGKFPDEGQVTHTSGTCNSTLGTVTGSAGNAPVLRLDN